MPTLFNGSMMLAAPLAACAACASPGGAGLGAALEAFGSPSCGSYVITGVQIDPTTYHWATPVRLLDSAEGYGPRTLDLVVASSVSPEWEATGTYTPTSSQISKALGYDVSETFYLQAETSVLVPVDAYARIDAYPTYQQATWQTLGTSCPGQLIVGGGFAYKPVGVYFDTCGVLGTGPCGVGSVSGTPGAPSASVSQPPPGAARPEAASAGAADGGQP
jgi:hypothetical protein